MVQLKIHTVPKPIELKPKHRIKIFALFRLSVTFEIIAESRNILYGDDGAKIASNAEDGLKL
jgi:hypothetical protein